MRAAVALGSNLGSRSAYLRAAVDALEATDGVELRALSRLYETSPVGPPQPDYLNAAVLLETDLSPARLLAACKSIETALGRTAGPRWGPRVVDLDLVQADVAPISSPALTLPHPEAARRAFVIAPLADVWPDAMIGGTSVADLLAALGSPGPTSPFAREADVAHVDHTADLALCIRARDEADLLAAAGDGLVDVVLDRTTIAGRERRDFTLRGADAEERLVALLSEIIGRFDAHAFVPRRTLVQRIEGDAVHASLWGETFDASRHRARTAVKAATYHGLVVETSETGTACTVVLDL